MKNRFRLTILLLAFALWISHGTMIAYAETEASNEGGMVVTQSGNASSDTTLSSLKIAQAALSPEFSPNQLTYTATVPYEVDRVALIAKTNCPEAKKVIRGTSDLEVGENTITITVTAENGSVREYRITLTRQEMPETTPAEGDETVESTTAGEGDSQEVTPEETTVDEGQETSSQETGDEESMESETLETESEETSQPETIIIPPDTEEHGNMVVETTTEPSRDLTSMLLNPMFLIFLVMAILIVALFAIVASVIVLREKRRGGDDEDEEDYDEDDEDEDHEEDQVMKSDVTDEYEVGDDDFEMIVAEESMIQETLAVADVSDNVTDNVSNVASNTALNTASNNALDAALDDDLDDDFEMLLEDDDDFDFLDF